MAGPPQTPSNSTPKNPPSLKKSTSGSQLSNQKSIASFFPKTSVDRQATKVPVTTKLPIVPKVANGVQRRPAVRGSSSSLTPAPSSDAVEDGDVGDEVSPSGIAANGASSLPSPVTPAGGTATKAPKSVANGSSLKIDSPSRKVSNRRLFLTKAE